MAADLGFLNIFYWIWNWPIYSHEVIIHVIVANTKCIEIYINMLFHILGEKKCWICHQVYRALWVQESLHILVQQFPWSKKSSGKPIKEGDPKRGEEPPQWQGRKSP